MSQCSSFTRCTDSEAARACVGGQLHEDVGQWLRCEVEGTGFDAQCPRKPPSLLLVLLEGVFSEDTIDVHFSIILEVPLRR